MHGQRLNRVKTVSVFCFALFLSGLGGHFKSAHADYNGHSPSSLHPFGCKEEEAKILKAVIQAETFYREEDIKRAFRSSGLDQARVFDAAEKTLKTPYQEPSDRSQIYSKVLALRFLRWTGQWGDGERCIGLLKSLAKNFESTSSEQVKLNTLCDAGDIAKACSEINFEKFRLYYLSLADSRMKSQIALGGKLHGKK